MRTLAILVVGALLSGGIVAFRGGWMPSTASGNSSEARERSERAAPSLPPPLQAGDELPDAELVDQSGRGFRLSALRGNAVVIAFIYTRCNVARMCPLATGKLIEAAQGARERGLSGARFLLVSFDIRRDDPQRLREHAGAHGVEDTNVTFATGQADEIALLARRLNTYYRESAPGVFEHNIVVSLLDSKGILRDDFLGTGWEVEELLSALEDVVRSGRSGREETP